MGLLFVPYARYTHGEKRAILKRSEFKAVHIIPSLQPCFAGINLTFNRMQLLLCATGEEGFSQSVQSLKKIQGDGNRVVAIAQG